MHALNDHPLRYALANELHARPFPSMPGPHVAAYVAFRRPEDPANRDKELDRQHLIAMLDRHGATHPQPGATHYYGEIGRHRLKWESHTEFVTYTIFTPGVSERAFDPSEFNVFPEGWLAQAPGECVTSALIRVERAPQPEMLKARLADWFVPESLAASVVVDEVATVAGDFRIDAAGHMRFAVFTNEGAGERRVGRVVQRLCEIETYKSISMLGFALTRTSGAKLNDLDNRLTELMGQMTRGEAAETTLDALLEISAELEQLWANASFRLGATGAYEAIVNQRIEVLREARFEGRQTFAEFMMRRYEPAMRTVKSFEARLKAMSERSVRAANLLRTRVDVERSAQNQALLESMDKRADLQLRLQHTVEGLSVVAISYYAVSLVSYVLYPLAGLAGLGKEMLTAIVALPVVFVVWLMVQRIKRGLGH